VQQHPLFIRLPFSFCFNRDYDSKSFQTNSHAKLREITNMPISIRLLLLTCIIVLFGGSPNWPLRAWAQPGASSFFSQGQAVYDPQDLAKSQQQALQELMVQGVTQALGTLLSPSDMGGNYPALQSKILKQPERYVQSYQIFSENPADGLYRIAGQVTVAMDLLRKDVRSIGLAVADAPSPQPVAPVVPEQVEKPPEAVTSEEVLQPAPEEQVSEQTEPAISPVQERILWAVAEKWDSQWVLPEHGGDLRALFSMSVLQESQDYGWSIDFPPNGSQTMESDGNLAREQLISLAQSMGIQKVVAGTIAFVRTDGQDQLLEASLQLIDVQSARSQGEIRKETAITNSHQEGAMRMAYVVVPQLDRLLHGPSAPALPGLGEAVGTEWNLLVRSPYPYVSWEQLEEVLRERFSSMQVKKLEVSGELAKVQVQGLGKEFIAMLQEGIPLKDGSRIQAGSYSPEDQSVELILSQF
jgi:hypothetical protein